MLLASLKQELRDSSAANTLADAEYNAALVSMQKQLCVDYDWTFLAQEWDLSIAANTQYADIPTQNTRGATTTINFERPVKVEVFYCNRYQDVLYGIDSEQYNTSNPDLGQVLDPISHWKFSTNINEAADANEIEVWPMPASAQTLRFSGQRQPLTVSGDSSTFDLDDMLIVYMVAADYLAFRGQPNAPIVLRKAQDRLLKLRAGYPTLDKKLILGSAQNNAPKIKPVSLVMVAS